ELKLAEYRKFSALFADDIYKISVESSLAARNTSGGTSPKQVAAALARAKKTLSL
ncbi:MAG TPA: argininosuccinate lyase, partial [Dehalococcoidales bacterium]|nr:argininosuccinate lyase [Dehalococcoidales bacterium]